MELKKIEGLSKSRNITGEGSDLLKNIFTKEIALFGKSLSDKKKESFYSELCTLLESGVDIKSAFNLITELQGKKKDKELFELITKKIIYGDSLSNALQHSQKFSPYEYYSIRIGEESGKTIEVLRDLARFFSGKIKQRRQFISALSYPAIVVVTSLGAVFFMMRFVVPMFSDIFKRFKTDLPWITEAIIKCSNFLGSFAWIFLSGIILLVSFIYVSRKKEWFRKNASALVLKIPVAGDLIRRIYLARFCHAMNLLTSAKTPLVVSLDMVEKMVEFYPIEASLTQVKKQIIQGDSLHKSLKKHSIYPPKMVSLIKVAEEVNQLDRIFEKLSKQYTDEVEHSTGLMSSLLEPLVIIVLGALVAIILIAMYLPLFKLSSSFGI